MAKQILNFSEWRLHLTTRLKQQIEITADQFLVDLLKELDNYPTVESSVHG